MLIMEGTLPKDVGSDPIRKKPFSCKIGIHRWDDTNSRNKICEKCGKEFQRAPLGDAFSWRDSGDEFSQ